MKRTTTFLSLLAIGTLAVAQNPRKALYEEFTGETCPPCAATNPYLDPVLSANSNIIPIKWQVPIPTAPTKTISLYQQNKTEIDTRATYYSVSSAPSGRIDGQSQAAFGATGSSVDHPGNVVNSPSILNTAAAVTTPFTLALNRSWDATYSTITVTGTITATASFTASGSYKMRLVMTEKEVNYAVQPGTNGETQFHWVVRKSFPDITNGTALPSVWAAAQTQTFSISCPLPAYIWDKSQVEMVAFLQDDGNKKVWQTALAAAAPLTNDAAANAVSVPAITCSTSVIPQVVVKNIGSNAITSMTLNPFVNGTANGASVNWTGNLAAGATTTVTMNAVTGLTAGSKTFSVSIAGTVNGATDYNLGNNSKSMVFSVIGAYTASTTVESFSVATFPPANWILVNTDGGSDTWARVTSSGSQSTSQSARYPAYAAPEGDSDDLILPPTNLTGFTAVQLTFDVASAPYTASTPEDDQLQVKVSTDCGTTWTTVYDKMGAALNTAPATSSSFVPNATQWRSESVDLTAYANKPNVLVKFTGTSGYGNNIYIDQVNLNAGFTSVKNIDENFKSVDLFPNPATAETSVSVNLNKASEVAVTVVNNVGQIIYQTVSALQAGSNTVNIDTKAYAAGIYNVVVASENGSVVKKLSVVK